MSCDYICMAEYVLEVLRLISIPLYLLILVTILRYKKTIFEDSFWTLCLTLGLADLAHLATFHVAGRLLSWGYLDNIVVLNQSLSAKILCILEHYAYHAQCLGTVFMSINRYTALTKTEMLQSMWTSKVVVQCLIIQWFLPCFIIAPLYPLEFMLIPKNGTTGFILDVIPEDTPVFMIYYTTAFAFGGTARSLLFLFLYGSMFYSTYKRSQRTQNTNNQSNANNVHVYNKAEMRLACMVMIFVSFDFIVTVHCIDLLFHLFIHQRETTYDLVRWWNFRIGVISDLYGYSNAYLLLLFSSLLRKEFTKMYGCKKSQQQHYKTNKVCPAANVNRVESN